MFRMRYLQKGRLQAFLYVKTSGFAYIVEPTQTIFLEWRKCCLRIYRLQVKYNLLSYGECTDWQP